jgi:hypothetical protein
MKGALITFGGICSLACTLFPLLAFAYLPPAFFIYTHIAEQKGENLPPSVLISVSRPQTSGTEEILGTIGLSSWKAAPGGWPTLSLLFANNPESLIKSVTAFGLNVTKEEELLRASRDQVAAMKDPPRPFYKNDKSMSMKRVRNTYAWVHGTAGGKSISVEKDTFIPLRIEGPCPETVSNLGWAKSGEGRCEIEFRSITGLKRGQTHNARIALWKDGSPLLFFTFERLVPNKAGAALSSPGETKLPDYLQEIPEIFFH